MLDTTVLINIFAAARRHVAGCSSFAQRVTFPTPWQSELMRWFGLRITPLGESEGWQAGTWRRAFAAKGFTLAQADCLIAAATLSAGGRLAPATPRISR